MRNADPDRRGKKMEPGLYEQVVNEEIARGLDELQERERATAKIDEAEAPHVLAKYLQKVAEKELGGAAGIDEQIEIANRAVSAMTETGPDEDAGSLSVRPEAEQLLAVAAEDDPLLAAGKAARDMPRPETSVAGSSLFTGSSHEPQLYMEIEKEIASCDRIDMLVSFIKWSGLRLIMDDLEQFTERGGKLRVITTTYIGATDLKAVEELSRLTNTEIRISYDTRRTRLHAKAYIFYRKTGFSTAYIGSSNLSDAAMSSGLEWNVKVTEDDLPDTMRKIGASFDSYWNSDEFTVFTGSEDDRKVLSSALGRERNGDGGRSRYFFDIRPYPYQQDILDRLRAEREVRGKYRNLIVAATGTGKTVIAAFDYKRFCTGNGGKQKRLLFVAHRKEILEQACETFRGVMRDPNFGGLFVGGAKPDSMDHVFISIQSLNSSGICSILEPDYYDYIVVDEFHHAAAKSYHDLLSHFRPKILLGLTATPERMDGKSILDFFDGRIAAEIRLPEAVNRKLLCPFQYFCVTDIVDLDGLHWVRGGYDVRELNRLYVGRRDTALKRADLIIDAVGRYVTDIDEVKGLGFCVSVEHARFMASCFEEAGIPSAALHGGSGAEERSEAAAKLRSGELKFIFTVDLYNEGVDIPEVNTVLFLRPTESLTVFLQQLGRGLRLSDGKECLTVLDFVGRANRKYDFEHKFEALLDNAACSVRREIARGFVDLPAGCYIKLEKKAQQYILDNIRRSYSTAAGIVDRIETFEEDSGEELTLGNFLRYHRLDPRIIYSKKKSFSRLCADAGLIPDFSDPAEDDLTKAMRTFSSADSRRWIDFMTGMLAGLPDLPEMTPKERRMMQMFYVTVYGKTADLDGEEAEEGIRRIAESPVMKRELIELLGYRRECIDFVDEPADLGFGCPLDIHCTYTRDQLLTAMDYMTPSNVREGVKWLPEKKTDILMVTLNKSEKEYSPTTMYNDYSVSEYLFHWQSQSTTSEESATGQRYIHHEDGKTKSRVLLFVRERKKDSLGTMPYTYLGPVSYVSHEGSRPMNILWKMERPIPARYLKKTSQLLR